MTLPRLVLAAVAAVATGLLTAPTLPVAAAASCEIDRIERIVAVGDVHGAYDQLVDILRTAGLLDARMRWSGRRTHLVQLGDVVDRGPDSRKVLDLLRRIEGDARRAGGAVHVLLGNHEVMRMLGDFRYTVPGEYKAFTTGESEELRQAFLDGQPPELRDELLKELPVGSLEMRVAFSRRGVYGEWLRKLNAVVRINGILFVHGGISPVNAGLRCDAINAAVRREITEEEGKSRADPLHTLSGAEDGPLWYRGLAEEPDSFAPEAEAILAAQQASAVVVAHTVTPDQRIRVRFGGRVVVVDTGMQPQYVESGRASALEIQRGVFTAIYADRRDRLFAQPAPAGSPAATGR